MHPTDKPTESAAEVLRRRSEVYFHIAMFFVMAGLVLAVLGVIGAVGKAHAQTTARDWYAANPQTGWLPPGSSGMAMPPGQWWSCDGSAGACQQWVGANVLVGQWNSGGCVTTGNAGGMVRTCQTPLLVNDPTTAKRAVPDGELPFK